VATAAGRRRFVAALLRHGAALLAAPALAGCDVREFARRHGGKLRLSIATGPVGGTYYSYGAALSGVIARHVPNVEATAEVTSASVDNLKLMATGRADLGFSLAPTLLDAFRGQGPFANMGPVPVRALAALNIQRMYLVTLEGLGVRSLDDLRGRVVSVSPPGSGSEDVVLRLLRAAGIDPDRDIERQGLGPSPAADALKDGKLDAFFWMSGSGVPALVDLAITSGHRMRLLDLSAVVGPLQRAQGAELFRPATIAGRVYPGVEHDVPTLGTANLLIVDAALSEALVYEIARALYGEARELAKLVPDARELSLDLGPVASPVPYHPGAVRYYREQGAWRG
jgi:TRAP transporter TAXI family solute receptor